MFMGQGGTIVPDMLSAGESTGCDVIELKGKNYRTEKFEK